MPVTGLPSNGMSPAASDLGLGDMLGMQVKDETEEQRRRRLQQSQIGGGPAGGGLASLALFGGLGAIRP